jgi:Spy/CpxP family protein refolding chaperone
LPARGDRLFVALAALAGLLIGFAASTLAYRYHWMRLPPAGLMERMDRQLKLTPMQHDEIVLVLDETRAVLEQLRHDTERQRLEVLSQTSAKIRSILTPEQQQNFELYFRLEHARSHHGMSQPGLMGPADTGQRPPPP